MSIAKTIAYLSMEVGLQTDLPTYSGGLGVLAGDTLRSAADLGLSVVGVTLLHRQGYLRQSIDENGRQVEEPNPHNPADHLERLDVTATVAVGGRPVKVAGWRYRIRGQGGHEVPVLLLDTDLPDNHEDDRRLTDRLYGGDDRHRLAQELILGVGGLRLLQALKLERDVYHLNEGHAALLPLELLRQRLEAGKADALSSVREACVFTTHTPVPAGHDRFPRELAAQVIEGGLASVLADVPELAGPELNMTELALATSGFVNGVAVRHAEVSRKMFPGHEIHAITNGVHSTTWTSAAFAELFDKHIPTWREQCASLRFAQQIPQVELLHAHRQAKRALLTEVARHGYEGFTSERFTIGFARRATPYKRATLLFRDMDRLRAMAKRYGGIQVIYAGKAHPRDVGGKALIEEIHRHAKELGTDIKVAFVPNYDMRLGGLLTAGVDVWLNNPRAPLEASGTSGMKASHNGVPNLSVDDGWWCEGAIEGVTGWVIHPASGADEAKVDDADAAQLYDILEGKVLPLYDGDPMQWAALMRGCIAHAASYFNTERMMREYAQRAYKAL